MTGCLADRKLDRTGWVAAGAFPRATRRWLYSSSRCGFRACSKTFASPVAAVPAEGRAPYPDAGHHRHPVKAGRAMFGKEEAPEASMVPRWMTPSSVESRPSEDSSLARPAGRQWAGLVYPYPFRLYCHNSEREGCKY